MGKTFKDKQAYLDKHDGLPPKQLKFKGRKKRLNKKTLEELLDEDKPDFILGM